MSDDFVLFPKLLKSMGISGLLPFLKPISRTVHLKDFQGESIGIDAYSWLHKAVFSCSLEIMTGKPTKRFIDYCVKKIKLLQFYKIVPILVFDGGNLPMKKGTENERRIKREERKNLGFECLKAGNVQKATEYFQTCIDVTPEMAAELILTLKAMGVKYVVAPYEADAQLAYLNKIGTISSIISEDSDLLCFGCTKVIYKLNNDATAIEIRQQDFGNLPAMRNWTLERFRQMCILSGCDYLASPPGIGVITAAKLLKKSDAYTVIKSWVAWGSAIKAPKIPKNYVDMFRLAELTFLHQRVYDPENEILVPLNPFPDGFPLTREISEAVGGDIEPHIAKGIALGLINPETKLEFNLGRTTTVSRGKISNFIPNSAPRISLPLNARLYNTSTAMTLKTVAPKPPKSMVAFLKPDPSKSGNVASGANTKPVEQTMPDENNVKESENAGLVQTFAAVVKAGIANENLNNTSVKKRTVVISKHFSNNLVKGNQNREVTTIEDEDQVPESNKHAQKVEDVQFVSTTKSKVHHQPGLPKPVKSTPFKSLNKKPQQTKISHHFMKPTIPRLSPLTGTDSKFSNPKHVFNLKRPLATNQPLSNLLPPSKKRFGLTTAKPTT